MTRACLALMVVLSLFAAGCEDTDVGMALQAGADAVRAVTLDDEDVRRLAAEVAARADREHAVAPPSHPHAQRLQRLTRGHTTLAGYEFDFKVYLSPEVNAFAMADGTIRVYSGLMDMLTDGEHTFMSRQPAPAERAQRLQENALRPEPAEDASLLTRVLRWVKRLWKRLT
jgi:putative metalloprotease